MSGPHVGPDFHTAKCLTHNLLLLQHFTISPALEIDVCKIHDFPLISVTVGIHFLSLVCMLACLASHFPNVCRRPFPHTDTQNKSKAFGGNGQSGVSSQIKVWSSGGGKEEEEGEEEQQQKHAEGGHEFKHSNYVTHWAFTAVE